MRHMYLAFLLLMIFMSSVFADNWSEMSQAMERGYRMGRETGGRWSGLAAGLSKLNADMKAQQDAQAQLEGAVAQAQAIAQYQQQIQQQQLNQGSSQKLEKFFSVIAYSDATTAQNDYNDFIAGRKSFNGVMFTLSQMEGQSNYSLFDSLQVRQLTTVYQGSDGKYYIVMRVQ